MDWCHVFDSHVLMSCIYILMSCIWQTSDQQSNNICNTWKHLDHQIQGQCVSQVTVNGKVLNSDSSLRNFDDIAGSLLLDAALWWVRKDFWAPYVIMCHHVSMLFPQVFDKQPLAVDYSHWPPGSAALEFLATRGVLSQCNDAVLTAHPGTALLQTLNPNALRLRALVGCPADCRKNQRWHQFLGHPRCGWTGPVSCLSTKLVPCACAYCGRQTVHLCLLVAQMTSPAGFCACRQGKVPYSAYFKCEFTLCGKNGSFDLLLCKLRNVSDPYCERSSGIDFYIHSDTHTRA